MPTAVPAFVPTFISFGDDGDDDFGEFEFAAAPAPSVPPRNATSNQEQLHTTAAGEEDDDWGDFVESALEPPPFRYPETPTPPPPSSALSSSTPFSSFFDPFPASQAAAPDPAQIRPVPPPAAERGWQKPSGALPLSLFGEEGEEDGGEEPSNSPDPQISGLEVGAFGSAKSVGINGVVSAQSGGLKDLIASLYGQADGVGPASAGNCSSNGGDSNIHTYNGMKPNFANGNVDDEDELDENDWEFKDALSSPHAGDSGDSALWENGGEPAGVPGVEAKAANGGSGFQKEGELACAPEILNSTNNDSGFQASSNHILESNGQKYEYTLGDNLPPSALNDEWEWGNTFISHDTSVNGFDFRSTDNVCNSRASNACHNLEQANIENGPSGSNPNVVNGNISLDNCFWGFKEASSNIRSVNGFCEPENIGQVGLIELEDSYMSASSNENQDVGDSFVIIDGCHHLSNSTATNNGTENIKSFSTVGLSDLVSNMHNDSDNVAAVTSECITHSGQNSTVSCAILKGGDSIDLMYDNVENDKDNDLANKSMDAYDNISAEPTIFVDFYYRLKQKSYTLALHHINDLKFMKADEKKDPDEELKAVFSDVEIKGTLSKLGIAALESDHIKKCLPNELSVSELLEFLEKPGFRGFDMEYSLSEKISLAEKDLNSAMWLFEHASYVLHILRVASCEEQRAYISLWARIVSACEKELQHGAAIWSQALHANIQTELLSESQGQQYFLALGEIYRVVEILNASIRLYKGWILLNPADSGELLTHIKKSVDAWAGSTLKQALEIISESFSELKSVTVELLESIKFISKLSEHALHNCLSRPEGHFCRLSLLPLEIRPEVKEVVWDGEHYLSKLANLWANRISSVAPQMPHIRVGR